MLVVINLLKHIFYYVPVLRIRIRDPAPFDPWDPGWEKVKIRDEYFGSYFRELRKIFFAYNTVLKFFDADANSDQRIFLTLDPGSGMEIIRTRDTLLCTSCQG